MAAKDHLWAVLFDSHSLAAESPGRCVCWCSLCGVVGEKTYPLLGREKGGLFFIPNNDRSEDPGPCIPRPRCVHEWVAFVGENQTRPEREVCVSCGAKRPLRGAGAEGWPWRPS